MVLGRQIPLAQEDVMMAVLTRTHAVRSLAGALIGLALAGLPASAWADTACGQVYLVNAQNELMRLKLSAQRLARFAALGGSVNTLLIRERTPIAGLASGEALIGIDFRPATGDLYGVGRIGADAVGQLYTLDLASAQATPVGSRTIPLAGTAFGVDFNPVPDLLRLASDAGQNIRVRPADGTVAGTDTPLAYPAAGDPNASRTARVVAVAYTNPDTDPQTNTVLHDVDANRAADADRDGDALAIQVPPNAGVLNTVGTLGLDADDLTALDIGPNNEALAALRPSGGAASRLYVVDLPSGAAIDVGRIGRGEEIAGLAIQVGPVCADMP
jgi:hypothetical protein